MVLVSPNYSDILAKPELFVNRLGSFSVDLVSPDNFNETEKLIEEALAVGVSLVPVMYITRQFVDKMFASWSDPSRDILTIALGGGVFHIISEESGVNNWFLNNSVAARKVNKKYYKVNTSHSGSDISLVDPNAPTTGCGKKKCSDDKVSGLLGLGGAGTYINA
jgi:hypothetical protein